MTDTTYNGHKNRETWNVSLWIQNDEVLYNIAKTCYTYPEFVNAVLSTHTPDGVSYTNPTLDVASLTNMIKSL